MLLVLLVCIGGGRGRCIWCWWLRAGCRTGGVIGSSGGIRETDGDGVEGQW